MREVAISLGERSYAVYMGRGLLDARDLLAGLLGDRPVLVVSNPVVAPRYLDRLVAALGDRPVHTHLVPDGEGAKTLEVMNGIVTELLRHGLGRDACLVALGGGVVGDVTGFAAACYQRGIACLQVPTTLLAQVDSALGGKTGVNHPAGKNMIGAIHQPIGVISDTGTLHTLPPREFRAGLAEVIKYGLILDAGFFNWIEANLDGLLGLDDTALEHALDRSCSLKADVVSGDEREAGRREILNLGHTFGHAIETALEYRDWLHGEAVAVGMLMAVDLSCRMGWLEPSLGPRLEALLRRAGLPVAAPPGIGAERLRELMSADKKSRGGRLRLVLLKAPGHAVVSHQFDEAQLAAAIRRYQPAAGAA